MLPTYLRAQEKIRKNNGLRVVLFLLVLLLFLSTLVEGGCLDCHQGIEKIADNSAMSTLSCVFCHRGNPEGKTEKEAHQGVWRNPSDLRVISFTCGKCHQAIVSRLKKSLHATSAGIISAARYTWAAQEARRALYATYPVRDQDGDIPRRRGALLQLFGLPAYDPRKPLSSTNHPVDDYLRAECLRCHVWTRGKERPGDYRASGCAACHVIYDNDGLYKGRDPAIPSDKPGYPRFHRITRKIPVFQCQHCHNRGGRIGMSYAGLMESDGYCSPWSGKPGVKARRKIHGKYYHQLLPDIHFEKGFGCQDCHPERDLHGDGNIYSKKEEAVEIECEDCHGTIKNYAPLKTNRGTRLKNLFREDGRVFLIGKLDGKRHLVPQVLEVIGRNPQAAAAMTVPGHVKRLECYACHAVWAPQCYGCHTQQDLSTRAGDWLRYRKAADESMHATEKNRIKGAYHWRESRSYLRWENPALGINAEGKVSPFIPGCQVIFTQIGPDGKPRFLNHIFRLAGGLWGLASNPIVPHTVRPKPRSCEDCHTNPKAWGLGSRLFLGEANGIPFPYALDQLVDEKGRQIQATSHERARPFNLSEIRRIRRVGACLACHKHNGDQAFWGKVIQKIGQALDDTTHRQILEKLLNSSLDSLPRQR